MVAKPLAPSVRATESCDLPGILQILNHEILSGTAHFGSEAMELAGLEKEFGLSERYPWVSAVESGQVLGFAKASPWKSRGAYGRTCEIGVYVRPETQRRGVASRIYEGILPELRRRGFKCVLGGIALPNDRSVRLHEKFGFRHAGTLPSVGWKFDEWRDVGYWALVFPDS